jgi:hypothetical protein
MRSDDTRNHPDANADPRLQLVPASTAARVWLFLLTVGMPMSIIAIVMALAVADGGPMRLIGGSIGRTAVIALGTVAALTLGIWLVLDRLLQRHRLRFDADALVVKSGFNGCSVAYADLQLDNARVVDLAERTEYKPMLKLNGTGLPRFKGGWYLLRDRSRAFVAITGGPRVLWLPTRGKHALLLQPRQPQALLDALRARVGDGSHHR